MATNAEKLASCQAAIEAIESGAQSTSQGDKSVTRADLRALYAERSRLERAVARESRGGIRVIGVTPTG